MPQDPSHVIQLFTERVIPDICCEKCQWSKFTLRVISIIHCYLLIIWMPLIGANNCGIHFCHMFLVCIRTGDKHTPVTCLSPVKCLYNLILCASVTIVSP